MPEIKVGPVYCMMCSHDVDNMSPMSYFANGDGKCERCGWEYKSGTEWVIEMSDLMEVEEQEARERAAAINDFNYPGRKPK